MTRQKPRGRRQTTRAPITKTVFLSVFFLLGATCFMIQNHTKKGNENDIRNSVYEFMYNICICFIREAIQLIKEDKFKLELLTMENRMITYRKTEKYFFCYLRITYNGKLDNYLQESRNFLKYFFVS